MKKLLIGFATIAALNSCGTSEVQDLEEFMVDISEFTINDSILKDGDYVRILGSSGNLTEGHEIDFYNLVVVESEETGDTINILVTNFYQSNLNNPRTQFLSNSSIEGILVENKADVLDGMNIDDLKAKSYDKVFYDREYIQIDVRNYPAISGNLGWTITKN